jgi:large-conductance mechanosensitive channel
MPNKKKSSPVKSSDAKADAATDKKSSRRSDIIRVRVPKGIPKSHISVLVNQDLAEPVHGFVDFLRERAIVGLAVGFVVATQVQGVIKQLIASFLDPFSQLLFGSKLSNQVATWHLHSHSAEFAWGMFIFTLIDFFVVVLAIYIIIKIFKLDKLDKPKK